MIRATVRRRITGWEGGLAPALRLRLNNRHSLEHRHPAYLLSYSNREQKQAGCLRSQAEQLMSRLGLLLVIAFLSFLTACGNNKSFDSAAWLKGDMRTRGRMCEDLIDRTLLVGQPISEAQRLLGAPDKTYAGMLSYNIDMGWPLKDPKHYGLQIHLDENRNIRLVKIVD